ncbi:hypothetical protein NLU13_0955 [Sarocladium strictum]|uniref:EthD domain-containing protein n=1 Tax=Sarocladium strictum TaxID=5046 RepID=A0AA39GQS6_SARSR|nr:hypothetical protein NLU13_0955 [Sarocladium strictum]
MTVDCLRFVSTDVQYFVKLLNPYLYLHVPIHEQDTMTSTEPLIRISVCIHRRKGISEEDFHRYWAHEHGPLAAEWLKRCGIVKYVQYHTSSEHRSLAKKMADAVGRPVLDWDGMADFYVRRYEDFEAAFLDSEYMDRIRPDEIKLIDMDTVRLTIGVDFVCINDGEVVEQHQRKF